MTDEEFALALAKFKSDLYNKNMQYGEAKDKCLWDNLTGAEKKQPIGLSCNCCRCTIIS